MREVFVCALDATRRPSQSCAVRSSWRKPAGTAGRLACGRGTGKAAQLVRAEVTLGASSLPSSPGPTDAGGARALVNCYRVVVVIFAILSVLRLAVGARRAERGAGELASFAVVTFVKTGLGGVLAGAAIGGLVSVLTRQVDDHLIEITFTTLVAWGSFLVAEEIHVSGVLSTVAAGIVMGSFGKQFGMSASTRLAVHDFWQYMGFVSNSFIFLMIGLELDPGAFWRDAPLVSLAFCVVVAARAALVYAGIPLIDRLSDPLAEELAARPGVGRAAGLSVDGARARLARQSSRGAPSSSIWCLAWSRSRCSLQGLTMAPLMRRLGVTSGDSAAAHRDYDMARGRALAYREVLREGEQQLARGMLDEAMYRRVMAYYQHAREQARRAALEHAAATPQPQQLLEAARALALIEREELENVVKAGLMAEDTCGELLAELDARLESLESAAREGERALQAALERMYPALEHKEESR